MCVYRSIFGSFCGFGGCGGGDGGCGGVLVAMDLVVWCLIFFSSVGLVAVVIMMVVCFFCWFGCNCGLWLKWWFGSCGCGCGSFGGCGCVGWWFFFPLPWAMVEVVAGGVVVEVVVAS